jgi:DNA-binding beta-propeller fold protein YncE
VSRSEARRRIGLTFLVAGLGLPLSSASPAQDDQGPSAPGVSSTRGAAGLGAFIASVPVTFDTGVIGIEHDGNGDLLYTSNLTDDVGRMGTDGGQITSLFTASQGTGTNPLGVTTDGTDLYVTDTVDNEVEIYSAGGAPLGTFSVLGQTAFPEGITYSPVSGRLIVVDGAFSTEPPDSLVEYTTGGALVDVTILAATSNDGAAYDPARCSVFVYDSAADNVTQYDENDLSVILGSFSGTSTEGLGPGEGVAVIGDVLYVMASGTDTLASFDISGAPSACLLVEPLEVPALGPWGTAALLGLLALAGTWVLIRQRPV